MIKEALDTLFRCVDFYKYDSDDFTEYETIFNSLTKQYDYEALVNRLIELCNSKQSDRSYYEKDIEYFRRFMSKGLVPKKTDEEYLKEDQKRYEEWEELKELLHQNGMEVKEFTFETSTIEKTFEPYKTYTFNYLRKISLERNKPITKLCEIKGLNINWLRYEERNN